MDVGTKADKANLRCFLCGAFGTDSTGIASELCPQNRQVLRLIDEPTSAALAVYGLDRPHMPLSGTKSSAQLAGMGKEEQQDAAPQTSSVSAALHHEEDVPSHSMHPEDAGSSRVSLLAAVVQSHCRPWQAVQRTGSCSLFT